MSNTEQNEDLLKVKTALSRLVLDSEEGYRAGIAQIIESLFLALAAQKIVIDAQSEAMILSAKNQMELLEEIERLERKIDDRR